MKSLSMAMLIASLSSAQHMFPSADGQNGGLKPAYPSENSSEEISEQENQTMQYYMPSFAQPVSVVSSPVQVVSSPVQVEETYATYHAPMVHDVLPVYQPPVAQDNINYEYLA